MKMQRSKYNNNFYSILFIISSISSVLVYQMLLQRIILSHRMLQNSTIYYNHYQSLNIAPTASDEQIKQSFLKLAKLHHPDMVSKQTNQQQSQFISTQEFIKIKQAYDILKQPNSRRLYDMEMFPQKIYQQTQQFYYYRQAQFEENHNKRRQEERRKINFILNSLIFLTLTGFITYSVDLTTILKPSAFHQICRQNIILANQNIDDGPTIQERRKKQYANEIKQKKIYGNIIKLKVRGAGKQTTKAREKRLKGIASIDGVEKQKVIDLSVYQDRQEYM